MNSSRLVFGIIVIVIGVILLLDNTVEAVNLGALFQWWPMLLILFGVWRLAANKFRSLFWPFLLIAIGIFLQLREFDIIPSINLGTYWPIIPIAIGIAIIAGGIQGRNRRRRRNNPHPQSSAVIDIDPSTSATEGSSLNATFSADHKVVRGDFSSGHVNVVMGSGTFDMRNVRIVEKPATLEVSIVMGEVKVRVPEEWRVRINNTSQMGETKDTRHNSPADNGSPDIMLSGSVTMGSLQITD